MVLIVAESFHIQLTLTLIHWLNVSSGYKHLNTVSIHSFVCNNFEVECMFLSTCVCATMIKFYYNLGSSCLLIIVLFNSFNYLSIKNHFSLIQTQWKSHSSYCLLCHQVLLSLEVYSSLDIHCVSQVWTPLIVHC